MIRANRPRKATTVGSSVNDGPNSMAGTFAHSTSSRAKVPSMTFSLADNGPMRASSLRAKCTASGVCLSSGGANRYITSGIRNRQTRPGSTMHRAQVVQLK